MIKETLEGFEFVIFLSEKELNDSLKDNILFIHNTVVLYDKLKYHIINNKLGFKKEYVFKISLNIVRDYKFNKIFKINDNRK